MNMKTAAEHNIHKGIDKNKYYNNNWEKISERTYQSPMAIEEGGNIGQEGCLHGTQVGNLAKTWHLKKGG